MTLDWRWSPGLVRTLIIEFHSILDCFLYILITHKNTTDIWTYPVPRPFQCTWQVMSYQVGIPETNTHHHTHKPTKIMTSFRMIGWLPGDPKIINCSYSWKHVNFHYANSNITVVQLNRIFKTQNVFLLEHMYRIDWWMNVFYQLITWVKIANGNLSTLNKFKVPSVS